jgi:hypothetical protein
MSGEEIETVEGEDAGTPSHRLLQAFIARVERLDREIADLQADRRDVLKEAKAAGFRPSWRCARCCGGGKWSPASWPMLDAGGGL